MPVRRTKGPPRFLRTLVAILLNESSSIIRWEGGALIIEDPRRLVEDVLKRYFQHSRYSSLQRQLNYFGFYKVLGRERYSRSVYYNKRLAGCEVGSILQLTRIVKGDKSSRESIAPHPSHNLVSQHSRSSGDKGDEGETRNSEDPVTIQPFFDDEEFDEETTAAALSTTLLSPRFNDAKQPAVVPDSETTTDQNGKKGDAKYDFLFQDAKPTNSNSSFQMQPCSGLEAQQQAMASYAALLGNREILNLGSTNGQWSNRPFSNPAQRAQDGGLVAGAAQPTNEQAVLQAQVLKVQPQQQKQTSSDGATVQQHTSAGGLGFLTLADNSWLYGKNVPPRALAPQAAYAWQATALCSPSGALSHTLTGTALDALAWNFDLPAHAAAAAAGGATAIMSPSGLGWSVNNGQANGLNAFGGVGNAAEASSSQQQFVQNQWFFPVEGATKGNFDHLPSSLPVTSHAFSRSQQQESSSARVAERERERLEADHRESARESWEQQERS